jgi:Ca-activated chloride channel family protein
MIHFEWWWALAAWPLPLLVRWLTRPAPPGRRSALRTPFLSDFSAVHADDRSTWTRRWPLWMVLALWTALVAAAARPQWLGKPVALPVSGRDLMLAVDLSGSMGVEDFRLNGHDVDRLTATKAIVGNFIERRKGDRIGLILFGRNAYVQAPLTFDRATVHQLLDEAVIGLAGRETAIGDAIGLAVKHLRHDHVKDKVLVLVTDGANTAGEVTPIRAAQLAASAGLKIYTIGIGADEMEVQTLFGTRSVDPSEDLDEDALTKIARLTGGRYFRARDTAQLDHIYALLDKLEPAVQQPLHFRPITALFMWPLGAAFAIGMGLLVMMARGRVTA